MQITNTQLITPRQSTTPSTEELQSKTTKRERNSNLELFRIITMIAIVAHHYVVNSGLMKVMASDPTSIKSIFLLIFGAWGKTGINCFVLITGYFMVGREISKKKFFRLLFEVMFYRIVIYLIFVLSGYQDITLKGVYYALNPITSVGKDFVGCFLMFYLFIPFLNKLIEHLNQKMHLRLIALCVAVFTLLPSTVVISIEFNYVTWFCILYVISSYIRLYGIEWKNQRFHWGWLSVASILISIISVVSIDFVASYINYPIGYSFIEVADSNKLLALITSICLFMYFKDIKIRNSKIINTIAASSFGVLMIHANSNTMRQWIWRDTLHNADMYSSDYIYLHAIVSVLVIYIICTAIDILFKRFIERPLNI